MTAASRKKISKSFKSWDINERNRYRAISGTNRNEKANYDLQSRETQFKLDVANEIKVQGRKAKAIGRLQSTSSPIDWVNNILERTNLPIQMVISEGDQRVRRGQKEYSLSRMSDASKMQWCLHLKLLGQIPILFFYR